MAECRFGDDEAAALHGYGVVLIAAGTIPYSPPDVIAVPPRSDSPTRRWHRQFSGASHSVLITEPPGWNDTFRGSSIGAGRLSCGWTPGFRLSRPDSDDRPALERSSDRSGPSRRGRELPDRSRADTGCGANDAGSWDDDALRGAEPGTVPHQPAGPILALQPCAGETRRRRVTPCTH